MDIYSFVLAGLLMTMGSLGDRFGRRRMLLLGAAAFGVASVATAYAPNIEWLIAARALMAVGGATLAPSTLSLIRNMFSDEADRSFAIGAWTIAFAGGAIAGPIVGGLLLEHFWWGSVFLINVPVMAVLLVAGPRLLRESKSGDTVGLSYIFDAAVSLSAILGVVFALQELAQHGMTRDFATSTAVGVAGVAVFVVRQRRAKDPMIDLALFRARVLSASVGITTIVNMAITGLGVLAFPFMQLVHGLTPLQSALCALPTLVGAVAGASSATALGGYLSNSNTMRVGLLSSAAGFAIVAMISSQSGLWLFILGYSVLTFGVSLTSAVANSLVLSSAPASKSGSAAGIVETSGQLGAALGIATIGTLASFIFRDRMSSAAPPGSDPTAIDNLPGAMTLAQETASTALLDKAFDAYTTGLRTAAIVGAALLAALALGASHISKVKQST